MTVCLMITEQAVLCLNYLRWDSLSIVPRHRQHFPLLFILISKPKIGRPFFWERCEILLTKVLDVNGKLPIINISTLFFENCLTLKHRFDPKTKSKDRIKRYILSNTIGYKMNSITFSNTIRFSWSTLNGTSTSIFRQMFPVPKLFTAHFYL